MQGNLKRNLALGATALAAIAFAGGAYAATQDPAANAQQTFLDDVAKRLHVSPPQLTAALRGAFLDQLSAAVAAGRLTKSEAAAIRQQVERTGGAPLGGWGGLGPRGFEPGRFGGPGGFEGPGRPGGSEGPGGPGATGGPGGLGGPGGPLTPGGPGWPHGPGGPGALGGPGGPGANAAAKYLGLSESALIKQLAAGKSLAQVAAAQRKSTSGLEKALLAAARTRIDQARSAGVITFAQEQRLLQRASARITADINHAALGWPRSFPRQDRGTQAHRPGPPAWPHP